MKRVTSLIITAVLLLLASALPPIPFPVKTYDFVFVLDITRSMNVQDYNDANGSAISRLEKAKAAMLDVVRELPCGSRLGLAIFTERVPALLYSPVETCADYPVIKASINHLDWRMAWVADSNINQALYNTLELMEYPMLSRSKLVFFTDGQEAPPINPRYAPDYSYIDLLHHRDNDWSAGLIVGVGQHELSRIPKFDEDGIQIGFYTAEDVPHASNFGLPEDPSKIEGYVPRNGPWGTEKIVGTEHLSSVRETYLKQLAEQAKMHYHHLDSSTALSQAIQQPYFAEREIQPTRMNGLLAAFALLFLLHCYHPFRHKWPLSTYRQIQ